MLKVKIKDIYILLSSCAICAILAWLEHGVAINYAIKTIAKISLFFSVVVVYRRWFNRFNWVDVFRSRRHTLNWKRLLLLGGSSAAVILIAYILLEPLLDLSLIRHDLTDRLGITPVGFIFVGLYITFGNSLLEEYFFRGFIFFNLPKRTAYIFSPLLFAAYHIPMVMLWFNLYQIALCFAGLWLIGIVFQKVNETDGTIWSSWIIHVCADVMIIIIGFSLFY